MKKLNIKDAIDLVRSDIVHQENQIDKNKLEKYKAKSVEEVLKKLLKQVKEVDFHEKAGKDKDRSIFRNEYSVIIIDELNKTINRSKFNISFFSNIIYLYNGCYWAELTDRQLERFLSDAALKMGVKNTLAKHNQFKIDLRLQFLSEVPITEIQPNEKTFVNLLNGTFEFSSKGHFLREPRKEDYLTYQLPFIYDPDAKSPMFETFLNRVLPDKDLQAILFEFLGYVFVNDFTLSKALVLKGNGANGKSVIYDIVFALFGDQNICTYSIHQLTVEDSKYLPFLNGKLLNYASEIGKLKDIDTFKRLVSNESIPARKLYGEPFHFRNQTKLVFNANELPNNTEHTDAYFRRFIIIPFDVRIPDTEQDKTLANKIISSELSGVFNKVINGLQNVLKNEAFTTSKTTSNIIDRYKIESDSVALFVEENSYKKVDDNYTELSTLYSEYRAYCTTNGYNAVSNINLSRRLESLGYIKKRMSIGMVFNLFKSN